MDSRWARVRSMSRFVRSTSVRSTSSRLKVGRSSRLRSYVGVVEEEVEESLERASQSVISARSESSANHVASEADVSVASGNSRFSGGGMTPSVCCCCWVIEDLR